MSRRAALLLALCLPLAAAAARCEAPPAPPAAPAAPAAAAASDDADFREGYRLFEKGSFAEAAPLFLGHVQSHDRSDDKQEWALFFLGICLQNTGFSHAAGDLLAHLVALKPNARIVAYSLEVLEDIVRSRPFDREGIVLQTLCDQEYGFVDPERMDFVSYFQGLYDWERGYYEWGDQHFRKIREGSPFYYRYLQQKALRAIRSNDLDAAAGLLGEVAAAPAATRELRDDARVTLARVWYEQGKYPQADAAYRELEMPSVDQAKYLLERAWGQYGSGNPEKAMGLLYSFEAPAFRRHFTPEYFVLKSLVYKDVCHYDSALKIVGEFHGRYDGALGFLRDRGEPEDSAELLQVLLERRSVRRLYDFAGLLERERAAAGQLKDPGLAAWLDELYGLQVEETSKQLRKLVHREFEALADDLFSYEEQAHLIDYEVGLDMYQRASDAHYRKPARPPAAKGGVVAFRFQGEFWNDELGDYRVALANKCEKPEEWDVFFK